MQVDSEQNPDKCIEKLGDLIKGIKFAMVTTIDDQGHFYSCPLTTQEITFDGDLWFMVGKTSEIYKNVVRDERVNASYSADKGTYVSVSGNARAVDDREIIERLWNPAFKVWFEQGIDDPNIGLIKIEVKAAEYWEAPRFRVTKLLSFAKAYVTGDKKSVGEHHRINMN